MKSVHLKINDEMLDRKKGFSMREKRREKEGEM